MKKTLQKQIDELKKDIEQLKREVYYAQALATGGVSTNAIYTYSICNCGIGGGNGNCPKHKP